MFLDAWGGSRELGLISLLLSAIFIKGWHLGGFWFRLLVKGLACTMGLCRRKGGEGQHVLVGQRG